MYDEELKIINDFIEASSKHTVYRPNLWDNFYYSIEGTNQDNTLRVQKTPISAMDMFEDCFNNLKNFFYGGYVLQNNGFTVKWRFGDERMAIAKDICRIILSSGKKDLTFKFIARCDDMAVLNAVYGLSNEKQTVRIIVDCSLSSNGFYGGTRVYEGNLPVSTAMQSIMINGVFVDAADAKSFEMVDTEKRLDNITAAFLSSIARA